MEYKNLVNGVKIPILGLGTWGIGGKYDVDKSHDDEAIKVLKEGIKLRMTHIDTAEMYGKGHCEELVGRAIQGFDRKKLFITTKVSPENLEHDDVISAAKESLKRLKTEYTDLYLIHAPNPNIPIQETMSAMNFLVEKKFVGSIGVSNFSVEQIKEAQDNSMNKIIANQVEYNLITRDNGQWTPNVESEIIPYCQKNDIIVIAYRPLAQGELAKPGFKILDDLAKNYNKTQAQVSLNWLISKKNVVVIPKTSNIEHLKENLGTIGWKMKQEDTDKLDNEFKNL